MKRIPVQDVRECTRLVHDSVQSTQSTVTVNVILSITLRQNSTRGRAVQTVRSKENSNFERITISLFEQVGARIFSLASNTASVGNAGVKSQLDPLGLAKSILSIRDSKGGDEDARTYVIFLCQDFRISIF